MELFVRGLVLYVPATHPRTNCAQRCLTSNRESNALTIRPGDPLYGRRVMACYISGVQYKVCLSKRYVARLPWISTQYSLGQGVGVPSRKLHAL
jgi:hypothetical protein